MSEVVEVKTQEEFKEKVKGERVLLDFYGSWCGPCKMIAPVLDKISLEEDVEILKVNVDELGELASEYEVMGVPSLFYLENGEVKNTGKGFMPEEQLKEFIK